MPHRRTHWDTHDTANCTTGCLFNILADPTEHVDLAAAMPAKVAELRARIAELNATIFLPDRGTDDGAGCAAALSWGRGFWVPFLP
jgi:hypothetical protein